MKKHRADRWVQGVVAFVSVMFAWWLVDIAGNWSHERQSFAQVLCFLFCFIGIDRILSAAVDFAIIAFGPTERAPHDT
jgi:hypothetical protein